jgi:hypothetical protein
MKVKMFCIPSGEDNIILSTIINLVKELKK